MATSACTDTRTVAWILKHKQFTHQAVTVDNKRAAAGGDAGGEGDVKRPRTETFVTPGFVSAPWSNFSGGFTTVGTSIARDVVGMDLGYNVEADDLLGYTSTELQRNFLPHRIRYHLHREVCSYNLQLPLRGTDDGCDPQHQAPDAVPYLITYCQVGEFSELIPLWSPTCTSALPLLSRSLEDVWALKEKRLEKLASGLSPLGGGWKFDVAKVESQVPERGLLFTSLMYNMKNAFEWGMCNGRAKMFVMALSHFLLDDEEHVALNLYHTMLPTVTEIKDCFVGTARFLDELSFQFTDRFPEDGTPLRSSRGVSTASSDPSDTASGSCKVHVPPSQKVHNVSPDCALTLNDYLYIICVFECTSCESGKDKDKSVQQNFHQILSMMHYQNSMFGCMISPTGYSLQLVVKKKDAGGAGDAVGAGGAGDAGDAGGAGSFRYFKTPECEFKHNGQTAIPTFINMFKQLFTILYTTAQHLHAFRAASVPVPGDEPGTSK